MIDIRAKKNCPITTTKKIVYICLLNGIAWVWCSYALAYLGRTEIAESLSMTALTEIVATLFAYTLKSLFEKRQSFGGVGNSDKKKTNDVKLGMEDKSNGV